ncbi:MAG: hypothetical protein AAB849_01390 [Patescibacteria group bacterium]
MSEQKNNEVTTSEILDFLKDNMVIKEEFTKFEKEVGERFDRVDVRLDKVENRLDGVEGRLDSIENRLIFLEKEIADIKFDLKKLSERTLEDADAHAKDILDLQKRVEKMEKEMTQMRLAYQH